MENVQREYSEEEMIAFLSDGSEQAFQIVYDAYAPTLYGIVLKIVRQNEIAEDLIQEAFVRIWQRADRFDRAKGSLFTWMLNIARNHSIDYIRSKYARNQSSTEHNFVSIEEEQYMELSVDTIGLLEQLDTLPPDYRQLIDLLYFQGYTQKEVSEELKIPLGTIKTRVRAAFVYLRELLKEFQYE